MAYTEPYSADVKNEAILRVRSGESKSKVARDLGISMGTIGQWTPDVTSRRPIDLAIREQVNERVRNGESKRKVAKDFGIGKTTVMYWTEDIDNSIKHPEAIREQAVTRARNGETAKAIADSLKLSPSTVLNWTRGINPRKRLSQAQRDEAIRRVEAGEPKIKVALDLEVSPMMVSQLTKHIKKKQQYSSEIRLEFINSLNRGESLAKVSRNLSVPVHIYHHWKESGLAPYPEFSSETQASVLAEMQSGSRITFVAQKYCLPTPLIRQWARTSQGKSLRFPSFSENQKAEAVKRIAVGEKAKLVAESIGATVSAVHLWVRNAVQSGQVAIEKTIPKSDDLEFKWISRNYPHLEDWRLSMAEWIKGEVRGFGQKISAVASFVERYLHPLKLPATREEFFRKGRQVPDYYAILSKESGNASKDNNTVHQFLQWVLLHDFSIEDDDGKPVISPLYRNPIPHVAKSGAPKRTESVRDVLPYGFIVQFRERIASGPHFKDWTFAQSALGFETLSSNNALADWFEVTEDRIDKNDPDCVWRLRERLQSPPVLEMWSPVRWVALLLKLMLPARTGQIRICDSGEADTWRYEGGKFLLNTGPLASGTEQSPWSMGIFRRVLNREGGETSILYFNTNKTADALKSGADKGQECPWPHFFDNSENPYYWAEKLRNWQEKYNPISRRTKWAELPSKRSLGVKSAIQKASYADTAFLFRTPETPGEEGWPITNGMLQRTWQKIMDAFEREFAKKVITHPDGSPIILNDPRNGRTFYPPHGLRVSLITAMIVDGLVPADLMMKIVGHSRLVMTLYYTKPGYSRLRDAIIGATERLDAKKDESILRFLTDTSNEEMIKHIAFNTENWQTVIASNPSHRNPVGWLLMHDGICFAGGNIAPLDGDQRVPGCHNGGAVNSAAENSYAPVPGGPMNCSLCRWKAAEKHHGPGLVATMNNQLYYLRQEQEAAVKHSAAITELKRQKVREEADQMPFSRMRDLKTVERLYEASMDRLSNLSAGVAGTYKMIQRVESLVHDDGSGMSLISAGDLATMNAVLEVADSELLQVAGICGDVEIFPDLSPGKAVFRMSQLLDSALMRESMPPFFMQLSEEQQLTYGNAFMRALASKANGDNTMLGFREVVSIMDSGESLQRVLGVNLPDFLPRTTEKSAHAPKFHIATGK
jgi:transposase-like protein